jgi:hypothetical protein
MKKSLILLLGVGLSATACTGYVAAPGPAPGYYAGPGVSVVVADQPYYTRGPYYVSRGQRFVWVGGHWAHRHGQRYWVHGRYVGR